jgi:hypothetical protein
MATGAVPLPSWLAILPFGGTSLSARWVKGFKLPFRLQIGNSRSANLVLAPHRVEPAWLTPASRVRSPPNSPTLPRCGGYKVFRGEAEHLRRQAVDFGCEGAED